MESYDLLVIGGGINGAGIARDAAGRGLKVLLAEKDDLSAHTSSSRPQPRRLGLSFMSLSVAGGNEGNDRSVMFRCPDPTPPGPVSPHRPPRAAAGAPSSAAAWME